jgi:hypothetical protein
MKFTVATVLAFAAVAFAYPRVDSNGSCHGYCPCWEALR